MSWIQQNKTSILFTPGIKRKTIVVQVAFLSTVLALCSPDLLPYLNLNVNIISAHYMLYKGKHIMWHTLNKTSHKGREIVFKLILFIVENLKLCYKLKIVHH